MYENIARIIFDYSKINRLADEKFIKEVISIFSDKFSLNKYINEIIITDNRKDSNGSEYSFENHNLVIDLYSESSKHKFLFTKNRVLLINIAIVLTIFHELDHAMLNKNNILGDNTLDVQFLKIILNIKTPKILDLATNEFEQLGQSEQNELIEEAFTSIFDLTKKLLFYYINHDKSPVERRANINSHIHLSKVLDILYDTSLSYHMIDKIRLIELKDFINKTKVGYKIYDDITNSPSYDYLKKQGFEDNLSTIEVYSDNLINAYMNCKNNYTLEKRIIYGLPLTSKELNEISINSNPFRVYEKVINKFTR